MFSEKKKFYTKMLDLTYLFVWNRATKKKKKNALSPQVFSGPIWKMNAILRYAVMWVFLKGTTGSFIWGAASYKMFVSFSTQRELKKVRL